MSRLRKLLSILLLMLFGLPVVAPSLAQGQDGDAGLPACCRRTGKHHCMMNMASPEASASQASSHKPQWQAPLERCPYCPAAFLSAHPDPFSLPEAADAIFAEIVRHPAVLAQTESRRRIARDRSRQKRGPPSLLLS